MLKKTGLALVAVLLCVAGVGWSPAARAADEDASKPSPRERVEKKRSEFKAARERNKAERKARAETRKSERKTRTDARKADRTRRRENREGLLRRLWPFDKEERPQTPTYYSQFGSQYFGSGNPRDTSKRHFSEPTFRQKIRSTRPKQQRDGMDFVGNRSHKKKASASRAKEISSRSDRRHAREITGRKPGEIRRDMKRSHRKPTGLNWNIPQKKKPAPDTHSHKGSYRQGR